MAEDRRVRRRVDMVMDAVRARIAEGQAGPGARLPSIRRLAVASGVSNATVVEAYDRLAAEGLVSARPGAGFFVAARAAPLTLAQASAPRARAIDPLWVIREALDRPQGLMAPGSGWLPPGWLPGEAIGRAMRAMARAAEANLTGYGEALGLPALRQRIAARLGERGIPAAADTVILTGSGSEAIDLACRFLLRPGDTVLVDDPCYFNFRTVALAHRAAVVGVPWTPAGPDLAAFAAACEAHAPRLYLTNATLHNPTGTSLSPAVAHRLLRLAEAHRLVIVEDDIFADFETQPAPRLAALDGLERVIHLGSFSKTLSAAARAGFLAARADWIEPLVDLKLATTFGHGDLAAQLVHRLLVEGFYRRHVEQTRDRLAKARGLVGERLTGLGLRLWAEPEAGLFLWAELPPGLDSGRVARHALGERIVLAPGNVFSVGGTASRFLRFNVAQSTEPRLMTVLARAMEAAAAPPAEGPSEEAA